MNIVLGLLAALGAGALWWVRGERLATAEPYLEMAIGIYVLVVKYLLSV